MQVYRGLDTGTAKPSAEDRARVPHHLIDVVPLSEGFDAARFCELARQAVEGIRTRGRLAILCGGTGLYFKAFLSGLGQAPPADRELRARLEAVPLEELLRELQARDPSAFAAIDRRNQRRVVRAVEVIRLTGRPFSEQRSDWTAPAAGIQPPFFGLSREPGDLRRRIEARVDQMFARGLVAETRELLAQGLADNRTAGQALGYRQVLDHLSGQQSLAQTVALVKIRTWQFARRQLTWFRRQFRLDWIHLPPEEHAERTAERIMDKLRPRGA
jgi:tRNA dimethylallyltransferase